MIGVIKGTGSCVPGKVVTNDDIAGLVETSDGWIRERTGIEERHIATEETCVDLAAEAARRALQNAGMDAEELDMILVSTISPTRVMPCTACEVQAAIGAKKAQCFDLSAACSGFVVAWNTVNAYMAAGFVKKALIIGSECLSKLTDWQDRSTCILFGDGAAGVVVECREDWPSIGAVLGELSTLTRDLLLRRSAPEGGAALLSGGFDSATLDRLSGNVPSNRFLYLASTLQRALADLYYSADRRTDAELCLLRLCDESLCGDLTALESRITRLETTVERGAVISAAVNENTRAAKTAEPSRPAGGSAAAKPAQAAAPQTKKPAQTEDAPPWDEPPLPEEPPMREEPGERVFDIPPDAASVRSTPPTHHPARAAAPASVPTEAKKPPAGSTAVSGSWWRALSESCKGQLPPMYRAFLDLCGGTLEGDQITVYAPDEITLSRLDNDRVRGVLSAEAEKVSGQPVRLLLRVGEAPSASPEENLKSLLEFGSQFDNIQIK